MGRRRGSPGPPPGPGARRSRNPSAPAPAPPPDRADARPHPTRWPPRLHRRCSGRSPPTSAAGCRGARAPRRAGCAAGPCAPAAGACGSSPPHRRAAPARSGRSPGRSSAPSAAPDWGLGRAGGAPRTGSPGGRCWGRAPAGDQFLRASGYAVCRIGCRGAPLRQGGDRRRRDPGHRQHPHHRAPIRPGCRLPRARGRVGRPGR